MIPVRTTILPAIAVVAIGCGPEQAKVADPFGWVDDMARHPDQFSAVADATHRDAWAAIHRHDPEAAVPLLGDQPVARARADLEIATLHSDLARLERRAAARLFETWGNKGFPQGSAAPAVAALSAACHGDAWESWAGQVDARYRATFDVLNSNPNALFTAPKATDAISARRAAHIAAIQGNTAGLAMAAATPMITEAADGFTREYYDPCVHATLARVWIQRAISDLGGPADVPESDVKKEINAAAQVWAEPGALEGVLFSGVLSASDLGAELSKRQEPGLWGAEQPGLTAIGVPPVSPEDGVEPARVEARMWNEALDGWRATLGSVGSNDGQALLRDLGLIEQLRQEWLLSRARLHLSQRRPKQALVLAEIARDVAHDEVGPNNSASVYAVIAEAELANGRTREALDALSRLLPSHPEAVGVRELIGDLAVLEGLDRRGDSKEY